MINSELLILNLKYMRHQISGRKLGKDTAERMAMFRNMAASLIKYGRIKTTLDRAKELRKFAERLVTLGKKNTRHAKRQAFDFLRQRDVVKKLFAEVAPAFSARHGGYTRIYRLGTRVGDAAKVAMIEYLSEVLAPIITKKDKSKKDKKAAPAQEKKGKEVKIAEKTEKKAEKVEKTENTEGTEKKTEKKDGEKKKKWFEF